MLLAVIIFIYFVSLNHKANLASTQDMEFLMTSIDVGEARLGDEGDISIPIEELEAKLLLQVAETQKGKQYRTQVDYVFLDKDGNPTTVEDRIRSVQYNVKYLNSKGQVVSNSVERIEINELMN